MLEDAAGCDPRRQSGPFQHAVVLPADLSPTRCGSDERAHLLREQYRILTLAIRKQNLRVCQIHAALLQWPPQVQLLQTCILCFLSLDVFPYLLLIPFDRGYKVTPSTEVRRKGVRRRFSRNLRIFRLTS